MASLFKPLDAIDSAKLFIKNMPLERVQVSILNDVAYMIWMAAPWRWTLGTIAAVPLVAATQDYTVSLPADFLHAVSIYITDGDKPVRYLNIEPLFPADVGVKGQPSRIAVTGSAGGSGTYRLSPKPGTISSPAPSIFTLYKKIMTKITDATVGTAGVQVFDDEWFWVYKAGVLWMSYLFADDQRAGSVTATRDGKVQYSGQRAVFEAGLEFMKQHEKLPVVDTREANESRGERDMLPIVR